jgi:TetR/AcrR family transcriptional regulator, mexJK operon transcriptional repressor
VVTASGRGELGHGSSFSVQRPTKLNGVVSSPKLNRSVYSVNRMHAIDLEAADTGRSASKRRAILAAAEDAFLRDGYLGTNMDEIASVAQVSKPTVYRHFGSKDALFISVINAMTSAAAEVVHTQPAAPDDVEGLHVLLADYAKRQLEVVLTPRLMQVRRLVIGEAGRFPDLGRALYDNAPRRAIAAFTAVFEGAVARGLLAVPDPALAAEQFNWLVMGAPLNRVMLLGEGAIPSRAELRRHAKACADFVLAAYRA